MAKQEEIVRAELFKEVILTENSDRARLLNGQSSYGDLQENGRIHLSLLESFYLMEKAKLQIFDGRNHQITGEEMLRKASKLEPNFWTRYVVYKDLRNRGYVVKTALKFGADFRVYDRGIKPGEDHAKWVVYPVAEGSTLTWQEYAAKNRVAHSTKKRLLLGVVDEESDVSYWEVRWVRP